MLNHLAFVCLLAVECRAELSSFAASRGFALGGVSLERPAYTASPLALNTSQYQVRRWAASCCVACCR